MKTIPINNPDFLSEIQKFEKFLDHDKYLKWIMCRGAQFKKEDQKYYTGKEYLKEILKQGTEHSGFPDYLKSYSLQHQTFKIGEEENNTEKVTSIIDEVYGMISELELKYGLKNNALFALYPPGGFISWHNNANACAYNLILTWSENGDGDFTYLDKSNNKLIRVRDVPGWQCKIGYFGAYNEDKSKLLYHCAKSDCWRMTISFVFDRSDTSKMLQDMIIDDITSY